MNSAIESYSNRDSCGFSQGEINDACVYNVASTGMSLTMTRDPLQARTSTSSIAVDAAERLWRATVQFRRTGVASELPCAMRD